jgi:hypothetical protein
MNPELIQKILKKIKVQKGCSIYDFKTSVPELVAPGDQPQGYSVGYFFYDDVRLLIEWGLVEAHKENHLVRKDEINEHDLHLYTFQLAPLARRLEGFLNINLTPTDIFGKPKASKSWSQVFMLMPFTPDLKLIYDAHIKKAISELGLSIARADDFFSRGSIMHEVWSAINYAKVVIADCTGRNPNVFYEIGIAHTLGKDTILISQALKDIPFDLHHLRVITYELTPEGMIKLEEDLKSALKLTFQQD